MKDKEVQAQLYAEYVDLLYRFLYKRLGNKEEAEDICQESFYKAFKKIDAFRGEASFKNWLFQIAKNLLADYWRKHYRLQTISWEDFLNFNNDNSSVAQIVEIEDNKEEDDRYRLRQILSQLPSAYQEVLEYRFLKNYSLKETARALNISENNVKIRQYRAIKKAQKYVQK